MRFIFVVLFLVSFGSVRPLCLGAIETYSEMQVFQLKLQGWKLEEKESYIDSRPGKKPYEMLKRDVQVVLYRLHLGTEELFCRMEYDSQQESVQENCSVNEKILQTKILD